MNKIKYLSLLLPFIFLSCNVDEPVEPPEEVTINFNELKNGGYIIRRGVILTSGQVNVEKDIYCSGGIMKTVSEYNSLAKTGFYEIPNEGDANDNVVKQNYTNPFAQVILLPFNSDRTITTNNIYRGTKTDNISGTTYEDYKVIEIVKDTFNYCK